MRAGGERDGSDTIQSDVLSVIPGQVVLRGLCVAQVAWLTRG